MACVPPAATTAQSAVKISLAQPSWHASVPTCLGPLNSHPSPASVSCRDFGRCGRCGGGDKYTSTILVWRQSPCASFRFWAGVFCSTNDRTPPAHPIPSTATASWLTCELLLRIPYIESIPPVPHRLPLLAQAIVITHSFKPLAVCYFLLSNVDSPAITFTRQKNTSIF